MNAPTARFRWLSSTCRSTSSTLVVILTALLPFLEQQPLYSAYNVDVNAWSAPNTTVWGVQISSIQCPSDPDAAIPAIVESPWDSITMYTTQHNSYVCNGGTWFVRAWDPVRLAQQNGVFLRFGSIQMADITDGTSQTIGLGERGTGALSAGGSVVVRLVGERLLR